MKWDLFRLPGNTIRGVIIKKRPSGDPPYQVFLIMENDCFFEFYSGCNYEDMIAISGPRRGGFDFVRSYGAEGAEILVDTDRAGPGEPVPPLPDTT